jgi:hypothetical protein
MASTSLKQYEVTSMRRLTFANLVSVRKGRYRNAGLLMSGGIRDAERLMQELPVDVLYFYFYDRIVGEVEMDGETIQIRSDKLDISAYYFVDITGLYTRNQVTNRLKGYQEEGALDLMDKHGTDYAVYWAATEARPYHRNMAYNSKVDVLLTR